ncbi:3441_t:CDS:2, partial [Gigaspora rosea]
GRKQNDFGKYSSCQSEKFFAPPTAGIKKSIIEDTEEEEGESHKIKSHNPGHPNL